MKRLSWFLAVVLLLLTTVSAVAQSLPPNDSRNEAFLKHWVAVVNANPGLTEKDFENLPIGAEYKLPNGTMQKIRPGTFGVWGTEYQKFYVAQAGAVTPPPPPPPAPNLKKPEKNPAPKPVVASDDSNSWWWLLGVVALALLYLWIRNKLFNRRVDRILREYEREREREWELLRDPITAGTPYVPGGIPVTRPNEIRDFFTRQAETAYMDRMGIPETERHLIRVVQVGPIYFGDIRGEGEVGFLPDTWRRHRIVIPLDAYEARFRLPDGTELVLQSLQGCMNPVRTGYGEVMRGFIFTRRDIVVPAPRVVRPAATLRPAEVPAPAVPASALQPSTITTETEVVIELLPAATNGSYRVKVRVNSVTRINFSGYSITEETKLTLSETVRLQGWGESRTAC